MDFKALKQLPADERRDTLEGLTDVREKRTYMKELSSDELIMAKDQLAQDAMRIATIEADKKEAMANFKAELAPILSSFAETREKIRAQAVQAEEDCFVVRDYDQQVVHYVAPDGTPVHSRPMLPEERQFRINSNSKTA